MTEIKDSDADRLVARVYDAALSNPAEPAKALAVASDAPIELVNRAIERALTVPWALASKPLIESLSDDQRRGILCMLAVVFMQGTGGRRLNVPQ